MREFAIEVINFLRGYYDDAYRYSITLNQGVPWQECLTLDVRDDYLTVHISESQMFHLYELYCSLKYCPMRGHQRNIIGE